MSLTVVIVSYNTREQTLECLASIWPNRVAGLDVIVVDNNSRDASADAIRAAYPDGGDQRVTVIEAGGNVGFARGVNLGVAASTAEHILLLNPDTLVLPGSLEALVGFAVTNPQYGLYGGKTLKPNGDVEPSSCWGEPTLWSLTSFALGLSTVFKGSEIFDPESLGTWQRDTVREVPIITGCLLLARRDTYNSIGGMDERFFLYGEDAEFSMRARRTGLRPIIVPEAVIVHEVGGSTASAGRKMSMVMAGKATMLNLGWSAPAARVGIVLLQAGALTRTLLEKASRRSKTTWTDVWAARADWREGYPKARETIFGHAPGGNGAEF